MKAKILFLLLLLVGFIVQYSCNDDNNPTPTTTTFKATLNGASETPADTSKATGTANFTFNPVTRILSGTVTFTGITPTQAHIHKGAVGVPGDVVLPLGNAPFTSPIQFTSRVLTQSEINDLMAGLWYVNIHSAAFPNGEIRGQLQKQTGTGGSNTYNVTLNGAGATPPNASTATGDGVFNYNPTTKILTGSLNYTGITPGSIYIVNGTAAADTVFSLGKAPFTSPVSFTSQPLTATQISALTAGNYFVAIRTPAYPNGEIVGKLTAQTGTGTGGY